MGLLWPAQSGVKGMNALVFEGRLYRRVKDRLVFNGFTIIQGESLRTCRFLTQDELLGAVLILT